MELKTVVMIVAPHEVQEIAVPILRVYAPETLIRVPAHLTVLYPFVSVDLLENASSVLYDLCADIPPFNVTLSGYGSFPGVTFMQPVDPTPIQAVFNHLFAAFPDCPPYGGRFGNELHPHLTVAEFPNEALQKEAEFPDYNPITFTATRLHLMYGYSGRALPWITHAVIPLRG
jgi:2'-5' RNA ligase